MFCSRCGQEQVSESVRFCSRCGFQLNAAEKMLAKPLLIMAMYLVMTICAIIGWGSITSGPQYMQVRIIITILAAINFYLLFSRDLKNIFNKLFSQSVEGKRRGALTDQEIALPRAQSIPMPLRPRRVSTAEMVQPPSITEHTTVLLDRHDR